ncbi:MAG: UDP-N-acetylmuramoyl-L-alanyl-D-glutamate--2,6-diaminopimelate ligase [Victivallales bacterium]|nr:UDP-N-acetylmuramoyl-L-alanyl-D-glutamate--2,6-diaminopimelate ligase [Victivallales bacterium]
MKLWQSYVQMLVPISLQQHFSQDFPVTTITDDSRKILPGSVFCAIKGAESDGHRFIDAAIAAGAQAVIIGNADYMRSDVNCILVNNAYAAYAMTAEHFFDYPASTMRVCAVTGTNGKTTTVFLLHHILSMTGNRCGLVSTVKYSTGNREFPASRTTPGAYELQALFAEMRAEKCQYALMEASSHGLDQRRIGTTRFEIGIFTNLTGDHLDYHGDMENYYLAKKLLFSTYTTGYGIINIDDPYGARLAKELKENNTPTIITSGFTDTADYRITNAYTDASGATFELINKHCSLKVKSPLAGKHNIYNLTSALIAAELLGISQGKYLAALEKNFSVPGRLEHYHLKNGADVYVDYAHTDDALRNVLQSLRDLCPQRLTVVFGCGGNRDRSKRPRMAAVAAELADRIIITSDNPRYEDPRTIIADILKGLPAHADYTVEPDRETAIRLALTESASGDIVLIAGKGHETYQEINGELFEFDDAGLVRLTEKYSS